MSDTLLADIYVFVCLFALFLLRHLHIICIALTCIECSRYTWECTVGNACFCVTFNATNSLVVYSYKPKWFVILFCVGYRRGDL